MMVGEVRGAEEVRIGGIRHRCKVEADIYWNKKNAGEAGLWGEVGDFVVSVC